MDKPINKLMGWDTNSSVDYYKEFSFEEKQNKIDFLMALCAYTDKHECFHIMADDKTFEEETFTIKLKFNNSTKFETILNILTEINEIRSGKKIK